jgi:hypothetical protein
MQNDQQLIDEFRRIVLDLGLEWYYETQYKGDRSAYIGEVMQHYEYFLYTQFGIHVIFPNFRPGATDDEGDPFYAKLIQCDLESLTMLKLAIGANGKP